MAIVLKFNAWRDNRKIALILMSWSVKASLSSQPKMNSSLSQSLLISIQLNPFSLSWGSRQESLWCQIPTKSGTTEVTTRPRTLYSWGCITQLRLPLRTCTLRLFLSYIVLGIQKVPSFSLHAQALRLHRTRERPEHFFSLLFKYFFFILSLKCLTKF